MHSYYVYVICNNAGKLNVGLTSNLLVSGPSRTEEPGHNHPDPPSSKLLYFECFTCEDKARIRRRDIDSWREKKLQELVEFVNPEWYDLARNRGELQYTMDRMEQNNN